MPIGTAERPINIKDLILDAPERARELPFDPGKEIPEEEIQKILRIIREEREHTRLLPYEVVPPALYLDILFPERGMGRQLVEHEGWPMLCTILKSYRGVATGQHDRPRTDWNTFFSLAADMKLLFPERSGDLRLTNNEHIWTTGIGEITTLREKSKKEDTVWGSFARAALRMKILFPNRVPELHLDEEAWGIHKKWFETFRSVLSNKRDNDGYDSFCDLAYEGKLLFPHHASALRLRANEWSALRARLSRLRERGQWKSHLKTAAELTILSADTASITDRGLELTMPKPKADFAPSTPPMPEVRRF